MLMIMTMMMMMGKLVFGNNRKTYMFNVLLLGS